MTLLSIDAKGILSGPGVVVKLLPEAWDQPTIVPRLVICHTNGGSTSSTAEQLWSYLSAGSVTLEPHFDIQTDGAIYQFMPCTRRADANSSANRFPITIDGKQTYGGAISIETQDPGYKNQPVDTSPWPPAQLEAIAQTIAAVVDAYGIPVEPVDAWNGQGIAPHNLFSVWSGSAHTCPGKARTAQMPGLLERINELLLPPKPIEETKMIEVIRNDDDPTGAVYSSDGLIKTWLDNGISAAAALKRAEQDAPKGVDNETCASYGPIVGPIPSGHDAYGRPH